MSFKPIPDGYHTLSPHLICRGAARAIEFYKAAFGAEELSRYADPAGQIACAELRIGDSTFAVADENVPWKNLSPQHLNGTAVQAMLYVEDAFAVGERAVAAGAEVIFPIEDQFYGERQGRLLDPFGHQWLISQHIDDVTPEIVAERMSIYCAEDAK